MNETNFLNMDLAILTQQKITQKELDHRWEFHPGQNWSQAPKYPIKLITAGQRELYSASKFIFHINSFFYIIVPFVPIFLYFCFISLNNYLKIIDLSNLNITNKKVVFSRYHFLENLIFIFPSVFISTTLTKFYRQYKKAFFISGVAFHFIYFALIVINKYIFFIIKVIFNKNNFPVSDVQLYIEIFISLSLCLTYIFTVKDIRRGWKLLFQLRSNLKTNKLQNRLSQVIDDHQNNKSSNPSYNHWIELDRIKKLLFNFALILIVTLFVIFAHQLGNWINQLLGFDNKNWSFIKNKNWSFTTVLSLIYIVFLSPLKQELVFRSGLMNLANNNKLAMFTSTLIFTLFHGIFSWHPSNNFDNNIVVMGGILELWPYMLSGLILAYTYRLTGNVWITTIAYSFSNLFFGLIG